MEGTLGVLGGTHRWRNYRRCRRQVQRSDSGQGHLNGLNAMMMLLLIVYLLVVFYGKHIHMSYIGPTGFRVICLLWASKSK